MNDLTIDLNSFKYFTPLFGYDCFYNVFEDGENFDIEYVIVDLELDIDCTEYLKQSRGTGRIWQAIYSDYQSRFEEYF